MTSTPERWRNICDLATRLSELSPVLVERTPPQPPVPAVVRGPKTDPIGGPSVTCLLKRHEGGNYLLAVNAAAEPVTVRLAAEGAKTVEVLYEDRTCPANDGSVTDDFAPSPSTSTAGERQLNPRKKKVTPERIVLLM